MLAMTKVTMMLAYATQQRSQAPLGTDADAGLAIYPESRRAVSSLRTPVRSSSFATVLARTAGLDPTDARTTALNA